MIKMINPATEEVIRTWEPLSESEIEAALAKAHYAFNDWRQTSVSERLKAVQKLGQLLGEQKDSLANLISQEMGKIQSEARAEVKKCQSLCEHYLQHAEAALQPIPVSTESHKSYVSFSPLGVVLGIMPWNFPFWQALRFAVPTIIAGNTVVLKHASNVMGCAEALAQLFEAAGFPAGVMQNLPIQSGQVKGLIADSRVRALSLTGSTEVGRKVGALAGQHLKKSVLELGGSDPAILLDDAPLEQAAQACIKSRLMNAGQSCIAAKRLIVTTKNHQAFLEALKEGLKAHKFGDPRDSKSTYGPLARKDLREDLHQQVLDSLANGARALLGAQIPEGPGFFYGATLLDQVRPGQRAFDEELFGPVLAVVPATSEAEAVKLANQSPFGLGASIYSEDLERAESLAARELHAGNCFVNDFVRSDPRLPFGGIGDSGWGRELSDWGLREFCNVKTLVVKSLC